MLKNKKILVLNTSVELTTMLVELLQEEGYDANYGFITEIKSGTITLSEFMESSNPDLIIYDIAIPYEENWKFFNKICHSPQLKNRKILLTTTNKEVLETLVGKTSAFEIIGKPFDLEVLIKIIRKKLKEQVQITAT